MHFVGLGALSDDLYKTDIEQDIFYKLIWGTTFTKINGVVIN